MSIGDTSNSGDDKADLNDKGNDGNDQIGVSVINNDTHDNDTGKSMKQRHEQNKSNNDNGNDGDNSSVSNTDRNVIVNQQRKQFYHQLTINPQIIQEEIAELKRIDKGAHNNLPAIISPPMMYQARKHGLLSSSPTNSTTAKKRRSVATTAASTSTAAITINDELASRWSEALRKVIQVEESRRNEEDLRSLVYKLMPEA